MTDGNDSTSPARPTSESAPTESRPGVFRPEPSEIDRLLAAARAYPLGIDYLMKGYLGSVAATFGVHAFVVEEARRQARRDAPDKKGGRDGLP